jgi:hypothetical protein
LQAKLNIHGASLLGGGLLRTWIVGSPWVPITAPPLQGATGWPTSLAPPGDPEVVMGELDRSRSWNHHRWGRGSQHSNRRCIGRIHRSSFVRSSDVLLRKINLVSKINTAREAAAGSLRELFSASAAASQLCWSLCFALWTGIVLRPVEGLLPCCSLTFESRHLNCRDRI